MEWLEIASNIAGIVFYVSIIVWLIRRCKR